MPEFIDAHGIAIVYDVHTPSTPPRGVVQLVHGVGEHAGRYAALIEAIVAQGWTVYADDHRGHGRTGMKQYGDDATKLGLLGPGGLRAAVAALWQFTELIRAENPGLPLVLLGHSWGSFMSQMLLNKHADAYDGVILSGTALRWPGSLNARPLNAKWQAESASGVEWLCSDATVGQAFLDDPLTTVTPLAKLFGPIDTLRIIGKPKKNLGRDVPVLIMVGRDDPVGGPVSAHRLAAAYQERSKLTDVTTLIYPNARHEIFNEVQQKDVRGDLLAWLDRRFPVRD